MKGERPEELVGLARTMRARAVPVTRAPGDVFDTCGTGGDRAGTFNISSAAALVVAACGVRVAKHGNRSVSNRCGSADVFQALGVRVDAPPESVARCLDRARIAFFFAPTFHPSMRHAGPTRRELGLKTAFNMVGPLTNPAGATRQLVGVPKAEWTRPMAQALGALGSTRAWVVHGSDGLDEISTTGHTRVAEWRDGEVHSFYVHPSDADLPVSGPAALVGGDAAENAAIITAVLDGARGPARDVVLLNAGAGLLVAGAVPGLREGVERAARAVDEGAAARTLAQMARFSRETVA
jgi:anthranilate phosphoribosyltransferase